MHGDGYETLQVPLFDFFARIFGLDPAQKHTFFRYDNQSNPSFKLCATNLGTPARPKQKTVQGHGQFNSYSYSFSYEIKNTPTLLSLTLFLHRNFQIWPREISSHKKMFFFLKKYFQLGGKKYIILKL